MPALSTNLIAASDSASKASAKSFAHAPNKPTDGSPFAMLLAATASPRKSQAAPADKDDAPSAPPKNSDVQANQTKTDRPDVARAPQSSSQSSSQSPVKARGDDERDKKNDEDDKDQTDNAEALEAQALVPAPSIPPTVVAPPTPPNPPVFDVALAAVTPNVDPGQAAPAAADDANTEPANPQSAAPPVNDAAPVAQLPQIQADGDGGNAPVPPPIMTAINPPAESRVDDAKPTAGKPAPVKTAADQPETTQNMQPPLAAADANMAAQLAMAVTPAANAPGATTAKTTGDAATQIASVASASIAKDNTSTSKAGTSAASPAAKGPQPATDATAKTEAPAAPAPPSAQAAIPASGKDATKDDGSAKSSNDGKPAHVAEAQPLSDIPAPAPQATPAPILPQHLAVSGFGIQASAPATGNVQVTSSMVLANADPAPDMDALAVSVAARAMSGAKQFQIRLDPPELGRVDVRLSIDASGKTQAHMTADQPQTLDLLQKDATTLTQALRDAGLDVSQSGLNFSLRGQDRQNDDSNNGGARRTNLIATRAIQAVQSPNAISFNGAAADARVDIHV